MRANTHVTLVVDNTAPQTQRSKCATPPQPFLTDQHPIYGGKAEVVRTQQSGGYWHFRMWISEERKYVRKTLKTTHLDTAVERAENEFFAIKANVNAGRRIFSPTVQQAEDEYLAHRWNVDVKRGSITEGRWATIKSHLNHFVAYCGIVGREAQSSVTRLNDLESKSLQGYQQYRQQKGAKNVHPSKIVDLGQEVEVMVLDIDEERRRISLGIKQCFTNPWDDFATTMTKGDKISGKIKSITDFGIFIGLDGGIDGLVHLSDISWNETGEEAVRNFKKGEEVETVVLSIDAERERISLGIKQLSDDPFNNYVTENDKGAIIKGTVKEVDAKGAVIDLGNDIEAILKGSEISREKVEDARNELQVGAEVEAKIINVDRKNRTINLSIKSKDVTEEKETVKAHRKVETEAASPATIGDLIKAQMDK